MTREVCTSFHNKGQDSQTATQKPTLVSRRLRAGSSLPPLSKTNLLTLVLWIDLHNFNDFFRELRDKDLHNFFTNSFWGTPSIISTISFMTKNWHVHDHLHVLFREPQHRHTHDLFRGAFRHPSLQHHHRHFNNPLLAVAANCLGIPPRRHKLCFGGS